MLKMPRRESPLAVELASSAEFLGLLLKEHRVRSGFSLRQLAGMSGVTNSEISKIESGGQSCRLDSLLRICAALGVPVGALADSILSVHSFFYEERIISNPEFIRLAEKRKMTYDQASFIACSIAGFAAQLALSSKPTMVAKQIDYPTEALQSAFLLFATRVETEMPAPARRAFLSGLKLRPIEILKQEGLFSEATFIDYYNQNEREIFSPSTERRFQLSDTTWAAFIPPSELALKSKLDTVHVSVNSGEVKAQWPLLKKRLQKATEPVGLKSRLAKFLGVKLASVSQWLSDADSQREPGAETTLQMLKWVELQEQQATQNKS